MTPDQAVLILTPVWQGLEAAQARVEALTREAAARMASPDAFVALDAEFERDQLKAIAAWIRARGSRFDGVALDQAVEDAHGTHVWSGPKPPAGARADVAEAWRSRGKRPEPAP